MFESLQTVVLGFSFPVMLNIGACCVDEEAYL